MYERDGGTIARSLRPWVRSKAPGSPRNGRAITRPTACSPDMISRACGADRVQLVGRDHVLVRGDLQHRVGRRVDDQVAGGHVLAAEVVDHRRAAVGAVAEDAAAGGVAQRVEHLGREAVGIRAQRDRRDDAHQLPVPGDRVLARAERVQAAVEHALRRGRDADERDDVAEPEPPEHRQVEPAGRLGDVAERVGARVPVVGGVRQRARAAGVDHDHEGPLAHGPDSGSARRGQRDFARGCASK